MPVVASDLLVACSPTAQIMLKGVRRCRGRELGLGRTGPLVVLDDAVLPGHSPLLHGVGLSLGLSRGEHGGIVQLGRLVLQLG